MRCVPHDEDTGGFFVATLRKIPRPEAVSYSIILHSLPRTPLSRHYFAMLRIYDSLHLVIFTCSISFVGNIG